MAFSLALPDLSIPSAEVECPDFVTFILSPNAALDYQTFHAEPQSLLSRRAYWAAEFIEPQRGYMSEAETAEGPSAFRGEHREAFGLMRREQRDLRSMWRGWGDIPREQCWCISVNSLQDRRSLCVLSFSEAITPWLNKLRGSIISAAPRENIYAAAKIDFTARVLLVLVRKDWTAD